MRKLTFVMLVAVAGCGGQIDDPNGTQLAQRSGGDEVWFKHTYGSEVFLSLIFPTLPGGFVPALDQVLTTPRAQRFDQWGVVNDPDCTAGDATTGFLDRCPDPNATGVIGLRKFPNPNYPQSGSPLLVGTTCAACHTGFDAEKPPADPNTPTWDNVAVMPGNQFIQIGKMFGGKLSPHDPRFQVFQSWAPGTIDTTAIWTDHVNNTLAIAPIFELENWPLSTKQVNGTTVTTPTQEHQGQDDLGCEKRALRVYLSEGMCARECSLPAAATGTPIDLDACRAACPTFAQAERDVPSLCSFMRGWKSPELKSAPGGESFIDESALARGLKVFGQSCAGCHSPNNDLFTDDVPRPMTQIGTNSCAARSSNWMTGRIWANFSSDTYKARPTGGPGFIRDVSLKGVWASAPFLHNNQLGAPIPDPSVVGRITAYEDAIDQLLNPTHRAPKVLRTSDFIVLPGGVTLPAGTPVNAFANSDGKGGTLCPNYQGTGPDVVENEGHTFGAELSDADKYALSEYLTSL